MAEGQDDARISEMRESHGPTCQCSTPWECDAKYLLARLDALTAERDAADALYRESVRQRAAVLDERDTLRARAERAEAALASLVRIFVSVHGHGASWLRAHRGRPDTERITFMAELGAIRTAVDAHRAALAAASEGE